MAGFGFVIDMINSVKENRKRATSIKSNRNLRNSLKSDFSQKKAIQFNDRMSTEGHIQHRNSLQKMKRRQGLIIYFSLLFLLSI